MAWRVERSEAVDTDLDLIFDFLFAAAIDFGQEPERAFDSAARRIGEIEAAIRQLAKVPRQGSLHPDIAGLRHVTKGRAILYFDADPERQVVSVLAVFWGGQDHDARILLRLLGGQGDAGA